MGKDPVTFNPWTEFQINIIIQEEPEKRKKNESGKTMIRSSDRN